MFTCVDFEARPAPALPAAAGVRRRPWPPRSCPFPAFAFFPPTREPVHALRITFYTGRMYWRHKQSRKPDMNVKICEYWLRSPSQMLIHVSASVASPQKRCGYQPGVRASQCGVGRVCATGANVKILRNLEYGRGYLAILVVSASHVPLPITHTVPGVSSPDVQKTS